MWQLNKNAHIHLAWMGVCAGILIIVSALALSTRNDVPLTRSTLANVANKTLPAVVSIAVQHPVRVGDSARRPGAPPAELEEELRRRFRGFEDFFEFFQFPQDAFPERRFEQDEEGRSWVPVAGGSGVLIRKNGYLVTNSHVIGAAINSETVDILVTTNDGQTFNRRNGQVEVVGYDALRDLAVLKIDADDLPYLEWGDSRELEIGEWILALGNPLDLEGTASQGIVSQKHRKINKAAIEDLLQITAMINPGNSGGALVNLDGKLVGINVAIATNTGRWQGVGFAIPSEHAQWVTDSIVEHGRVMQGYIGVRMSEETDGRMSRQAARYHGLPQPGGMLIESVTPGGAADQAGLQRGDVVVQVREGNQSFEIATNRDLLAAVASRKIGAEVEFTFYRNGEKKTTTVTIAERPPVDELSRILDTQETEAKPGRFDSMGVTVDEVQEPDAGLQITDIDAEGPAATAEPFKMQKDDIITEVNGQDVRTLDDLKSALEGGGRDGLHRIKFLRSNSEAQTYVKI